MNEDVSLGRNMKTRARGITTGGKTVSEDGSPRLTEQVA